MDFKEVVCGRDPSGSRQRPIVGVLLKIVTLHFWGP
jgi:hypothetical protein